MTHQQKHGLGIFGNDVVKILVVGIEVSNSVLKKITILDILTLPCRFQRVDPLLQQLFDERWTVLVLSQKAQQIQITQLLC